MKTAVECLPCFLRQGLQVARLVGCDEQQQHLVLCRVAALLPELAMDLTPPANAIRLYETIAAATGVTDPYAKLKRASNAKALARISQLRQEVRLAEVPLAAAIRFAIAGNIIDYGASEKFDVEAALNRSRELPLAIDGTDALIAKIHTLPRGATILYLADNCGEIVYDHLLVELLAELGGDVTVAVKRGAIINDALAEDARIAGLHHLARIIDNGTACPGTPLPNCSTEFLQCFDQADLVIAKGQGNFETLSTAEREIFFLLTIKCKVVGRHLAEISGADPALLPGRGEMVVYGNRCQAEL